MLFIDKVPGSLRSRHTAESTSPPLEARCGHMSCFRKEIKWTWYVWFSGREFQQPWTLAGTSVFSVGKEGVEHCGPLHTTVGKYDEWAAIVLCYGGLGVTGPCNTTHPTWWAHFLQTPFCEPSATVFPSIGVGGSDGQTSSLFFSISEVMTSAEKHSGCYLSCHFGKSPPKNNSYPKTQELKQGEGRTHDSI